MLECDASTGQGKGDNGRVPPFHAFGPDHLGALALTAGLAAAAVAVTRRDPRGGAALGVRAGLGLALVGLLAAELGSAAREGWLTWKTLLPLELCDAALLLALLVLWRQPRWAAELLWFWAGAGTLLAMLTPDVGAGFPSLWFVAFFGLHGLVVATAAVAVFGLGLRPRPGAAGRAFLVTLSWALGAGLVNLALGTNFMYLRHKPVAPTLLDHFGPWPLYLLVAGGLAAILFWLLERPFAARRAP